MTILIWQSIRLTLVFTVLTGVIYPLAITGVAQLAFPRQANGSIIVRDGKATGSALLAQKFENPRYFWPRPSAGDFATVPSGASNFGPTSAALQSNVVARATAVRAASKLSADAPVPGDLVFASASGLDPHISPEAANLQATRVADARGIGAGQVAALVECFVEPPQFGFLGEPRVNVLLLNLALDQLPAK
ncbi:MAG: potassium-transporting ATPase subunit KdpC [Verrucomicrobia bacterium]|nr:potassium-transporting ATPase subunit KdpC [Verrucomicrobiota bacterium]